MYRAPQRLFLPLCLLTILLLLAYLCLFLRTSIQFATSPLYFYHGAYRVYPYFIRSREVTEDRITLVLHTSADALRPEALSTAIDNWKGPMSIGIYFDAERDTMADIREKMLETFQLISDGSLAAIVAVHLLCRASPSWHSGRQSQFTMNLRPVLILFATVLHSTAASPTVARKFLCYSPQASRSHVNFLAKLTDSLLDAGHEVVYLSPVDMNVHRPGTSKARIIELPQAANAEVENTADSTLLTQLWEASGWWQVNWSRYEERWVATCNSTIHYPGLIDQMREEKFDAAFGESIDWCFAGNTIDFLFVISRLQQVFCIWLANFAFTESFSLKDGFYAVHQTPNLPSYVKTLTAGHYNEDMTFLERAANLFYFLDLQRFNYKTVPMYQAVFEKLQPGFPSLVDLAASASFVFLNSDPLVDFPRPSSAILIDVGGIAVSQGHRRLNDTWSSLLSLRPRTILFSFGTFAKAHGMPKKYRKTVIMTIKKFPNVTFIWKYEKPEHRVSKGVSNLVEATWLPQSDIFDDPRLTAFITHGGQGSISEANYAGVPLVVIPIIFDQARNAYQVKRNKLGIVVHKTELAEEGPLETAIREVLENPDRYANQAKKTAKMRAEKPFTAREIFVRNMDFLASHGPLRQLEHYGKNLSFVKFYLLDVIALGIVLVVFTIVASAVVLHKLELSNPEERSAAYPINVVRNVARQFTTTRFLLIGDMDHLFSADFERKMRDLALRTLEIGKKRVLVYRFFEIEEEESAARKHRIGKADLKKLIDTDRAVVFHSLINMTNGHEIPKLEEWLANEEKERTGIFEGHLKYEKREWEPQIVFTRDAPMHDESFPYRIRNNLALRWEMCRAGYEFSLVDDLFVYHRGIVRFGSECFHKKEAARRINIRRYLPILTIFKRKMDLLYPSTKESCAIEDETRLY